MKRIVFFVSSMEGGGAERVASLLCNRWAAAGHDVTLVPTFSGGGSCHYPLHDRVMLRYLSHDAGAGRLRRWLAMRRMIQDLNPDVVVSFLTHVNVATILAVSGLGLPVVVSERVYPPMWQAGRFWSVMRKLTYSRAAAVVMQTEQGVRWLSRTIPGARGKVIPNPCVYPLPAPNTTVRPSVPASSDGHLLVAAGRLVPQKGFDRLLEAFTELARDFPDWRLAILGEGDQRRELENRVSEAGLDERVLLPGHVADPAGWYECADVFVMSSRFEGFPNTMIEAMAHGLPAVSIDCPTGPADIVRPGVDGLLVSQEKGTAGLRDALHQIMSDESLRERLGRRALDVRDRFSPGKVGGLWDALLDRVVR